MNDNSSSGFVDAIPAKGNELETTADFAAACRTAEFCLALLGGLACRVFSCLVDVGGLEDGNGTVMVGRRVP